MFFSRQLKVSKKFGPDYIETVIEFLNSYYTIVFEGKREIDMDLVYFNYNFDGKKISFISEGMVGTSIYGKSDVVKNIVSKVKEDNPELFDILIEKN
ncbi:MAG: hypothetical protein KDD14_25080 [Saprospiraceae bacterium]|nr:hypothetical protein [Saprospiraceae bacterium]